MVHFDHLVIFSYLQETMRVLEPGGMALFHHSAYPGNPGGDYKTNPSWRNFMPAGLFVDYVAKAGLAVCEQTIIPWGKHISIDGVTLVRKPA